MTIIANVAEFIEKEELPSERKKFYTLKELERLYRRPLMELLHLAQQTHREHHDIRAMQVCSLLSVKTGGCPENCGYCPQSAHYDTGVQAEKLLALEDVLAAAQEAKRQGSARFCMGAAWRQMKDGAAFEQVLDMVRAVAALELEVCCTMGMLTPQQAQRLKEAGLTAYNHNLDSGPNYYDKVVTTRTYQDRLDTLSHVADAGISICCGGILGMGESVQDRIELLWQLLQLETPPESIPINTLIAVENTPMAEQQRIDFFEVLRMIAVARIVFTTSKIRLSAGRLHLSFAEQTLCFLSGANSIFAGDKLLTTANNDIDSDKKLFSILGIDPSLE